MKTKPKPATAGEKMVLARVRETLGPKTMTLHEFRTRGALCHCRAEAKAHDRAIARAVRKERDRCMACVRKSGSMGATLGNIYDGKVMQ